MKTLFLLASVAFAGATFLSRLSTETAAPGFPSGWFPPGTSLARMPPVLG